MPIKDKDARREAHKKYMKEVWYPKNSEIHKARTQHVRDENRNWFKSLKSTLSCVDCGESHTACLDFHHIDPSSKVFEVAKAVSKNFKRSDILAEIDKCIVLCSNCHRKRHYSAG